MPVPPITLSVGLTVEVPAWVIPLPAVTEVTVPALLVHALSFSKIDNGMLPAAYLRGVPLLSKAKVSDVVGSVVASSSERSSAKLTDPEVPPPDNPRAAPTDVMSPTLLVHPWSLLNCPR